MGDCMPKEQEDYIKAIQKHCLDATNMTEQDAWDFAFRCWQLGYEKKKEHVDIEGISFDNFFEHDLTEYELSVLKPIAKNLKNKKPDVVPYDIIHELIRLSEIALKHFISES